MWFSRRMLLDDADLIPIDAIVVFVLTLIV